MALAPYYDRAAIAASQVVAGFDADVFRVALQDLTVGIAFAEEAATSEEGVAALDLTVRLLARLYPNLSVHATGTTADKLAANLRDLAAAINPVISFTDDAEVGITVGLNAHSWPQSIYLGCDGWLGRISVTTPLEVGSSTLPYGAGAAACLAASAVFRVLLDHDAEQPQDAELSCFAGASPIQSGDPPSGGWTVPERTVLVGAGAIGQAATWALARSPLQGAVHIVDGEPIDEGNLQRYVLSTPADIGQPKATFAATYSKSYAESTRGALSTLGIDQYWAHALGTAGHSWDAALAAVDSAQARRSIQAALPRWTANAWTQQGGLGVSDHHFINGACVACLYLPTGATRNEDEIVAEALGVPEQIVAIRTLLAQGTPVPTGLLQLIAARLQADSALLMTFENRSIRDLYVDGICGGTVLPLRSGVVSSDVHVPLAHQSALAGVLLAARLARRAAGVELSDTEVTRLDPRADPPPRPTQLAAKDPRGICLCQDNDYIAAYLGA